MSYRDLESAIERRRFPAISPVERKHEHLMLQLIDALHGDARVHVQTPGGPRPSEPASHVVFQLLGARGAGDELLRQALHLIGHAAMGVDIRLQAMAWCAEISKQYADAYSTQEVERSGRMCLRMP